MLKESGGLFFQIAGWSTVVGALLWVVVCYLYWGHAKKVKQSEVCEALNDELSKGNRTRALLFGYLIVFCLIWLLIPATDFWDFEVTFVVRAIATIAIIFPMAYFAVLELKNDEGAE
jgi:hypothetical protein